MKKAIVAVTNDLTTDQRVDRVCQSLVKEGFEVVLVGRELPSSKPLGTRSYSCVRMRLLFTQGPLFYAEYNLRLFFFLLFHSSNLVVSNDLDTLLGSYLAVKMTRRVHFHDCHEYFRGVPELNGRTLTTRIWKWIEDWIFPRLTCVYAVNSSIAGIYQDEYKINVAVIRNVPFRKKQQSLVRKSDLGIPEDYHVIIYQGAVNVDRGIEEAIDAMSHLQSKAILIIAGVGDVYPTIQQQISASGLSDKVRLLGQVPLEKLHGYTMLADIGLSIEKDVSLNYHYCLPNKFMDYIQAGVPLLVSPLPEMKRIVDHYQIGEFLESHDPKKMAVQLDMYLGDVRKRMHYKENLEKAASDLCWEEEEKVFLKLLKQYA